MTYHMSVEVLRRVCELGLKTDLATKGEKIVLTTDKMRKQLPTSDKKIN